MKPTGRPAHSRLHKCEKFADWQLVELRESVSAPFPAKRLGLEARAVTVGTGIVRPVARKKHPHVHLVGRLFEVAEEALQPIPVFRPGMILAIVARRTVDHKGLLLRGERGKRNVGRDAQFSGKLEQITL